MSTRPVSKRSFIKLFVLGAALTVGGIGLIWWTWNAPAPQSEPGPGEKLVTVDVLRLGDEVISSSITMSKSHRVSYVYTVDGRAYCADGRVVDPGTDPERLCSDRFTKIGRGTFDVLDESAGDTPRVKVIYDSDDPWRSFPVETREPPLRKTLIGLGLMLAGVLLFVFGVTRLKAQSAAG